MKKWIGIFFTIGLILQIYLSANSWIGGDQIHLLHIGNNFAQSGNLIGFGKITGGAGSNIGALLELFVGIPLMIAQNFRSPMVLIVLLCVLSYFLIAKEIFKIWDYKGVLIFTLIYWLSPVRLYNSGFMWEPSYIFIFSALHFVASYRLHKSKSLLYSILLILSVFLAAQIHNSALILLLSSLFLLIRKQLKLDYRGVLIGGGIVLITLLPTIISIYYNNVPVIRQNSLGYLFYSLVNVGPFLKGILYSVKMGGVDVVRQIKEISYTFPGHNILATVLSIISILTVGLSIYASYFLYRYSVIKKYKAEFETFTSDEKWIHNYALSFFVAVIISSAMSPITLQGWMLVVTLPALMLPVMFFFNRYFDSTIAKRNRHLKVIVMGYAILQIGMMLYIAEGKFIFNRDAKYPVEIYKPENKELMKLF